jgi:hypothetical protein
MLGRGRRAALLLRLEPTPHLALRRNKNNTLLHYYRR